MQPKIVIILLFLFALTIFYVVGAEAKANQDFFTLYAGVTEIEFDDSDLKLDGENYGAQYAFSAFNIFGADLLVEKNDYGHGIYEVNGHALLFFQADLGGLSVQVGGGLFRTETLGDETESGERYVAGAYIPLQEKIAIDANYYRTEVDDNEADTVQLTLLLGDGGGVNWVTFGAEVTQPDDDVTQSQLRLGYRRNF